MSFLNNLKEQSNITYTENGAVTNASTFSDCLDLFYMAGAMRNADTKEISKAVVKAFAEDRDLTMKILFFARDIRGGLGERRVFRTILKWLAENKTSSAKRNIKYI